MIYVTTSIHAHQRELRCNGVITFLVDLKLEETGVLIDERSDAYDVEINATTALTKIIHTYAKGASMHIAPTVSMKEIGHRDRNRPYNKHRTPKHDK